MDDDVRAVVLAVREQTAATRELTLKVEGLCCHLSSIDADYGRVKTTLMDHEERIRRIELGHNIEPTTAIGEDSALFPSIRSK